MSLRGKIIRRQILRCHLVVIQFFYHEHEMRYVCELKCLKSLRSEYHGFFASHVQIHLFTSLNHFCQFYGLFLLLKLAFLMPFMFFCRDEHFAIKGIRSSDLKFSKVRQYNHNCGIFILISYPHCHGSAVKYNVSKMASSFFEQYGNNGSIYRHCVFKTTLYTVIFYKYN